ncbi:MAG: hypothetical protein HY727_15150 [Candidatus Rokubacteria bacterium]|nr:hypothetical protein [Candidatus Rokubacteria bacterium]
MSQYKTGLAKILSADPPPACVATDSGVGGNVDVGAHTWKVVFVHSAGGKTLGGTTSNTVTIAGSAKRVDLSSIPLGPAGTTAREIYRTKAGQGSYFLAVTINNNVDTTVSDNVADASLGAAIPTTATYPTNRVVLSGGGVTTGNISVTTPAQLFKFVGDSSWYNVSAVPSASEFQLSAVWTGSTTTFPLDTPTSYVVEKDFTTNLGLPEMSAGDADFWSVYTTALRDLDGLIGGHKKITGYTELIQGLVAADVILGVRGAAAQTGDLQRWETSAGIAVARLTKDGDFRLTAAALLGWASGEPVASALDVILVRDAAAILALKNGTTAQKLRVYGTTTGPKYLEFTNDGTGNANINTTSTDNLILNVVGAANIYFRTNNTYRWLINDSGHLIGNLDNTYDLGAAGATRPRTAYLGTAVAIGANPASAGLGRFANAGWLAWRNAANGADVNGLKVNARDVVELGIVSAARAYHNADQAITTATETALALNSERYDTDGIHDTVTNNSRLTCQTAGKYLIVGIARFKEHATGQRRLSIQLNGVTVIARATEPTNSGTAVTELAVATVYDLAATDYVELIAYQDSGGNLNVESVGNHSPEFMMHRLSA